MRLRIGTRGSRLARTQSATMARALQALGFATELVVIETAGDRDQTSAFAAIGAPGVFVREIQRALFDDTIDVAVHSYKDLPADATPGLRVTAVPRRASPADHLLIRREVHDTGCGHLHVKTGARIGTSAARRQALVAELRPDCVCLPLRGNVPTRVAKLQAGTYDGIVLAAAGLERLQEAGYTLPSELVTQPLDPWVVVPAPSQGALALEMREADARADRVAKLDHAPTRVCVAAERDLMRRLQAGCEIALGAWCRSDKAHGFSLDACWVREAEMLRTRQQGGKLSELVAQAFGDLTEPGERPTP